MKKILTICLLLTIAFTSQAQDGKPTKEETVKFIQKTLESLKGSIYIMNLVITEYDFEQNSLFFKAEKGRIIMSNRYSQINWDKLVKIDFTNAQSTLEIQLIFSTTFKQESLVTHVKDETTYEKYIQIPIPESKKGSMEKAFLRLSEIAKEENKDPFQD
ncbi:MAG: hypothetical protein ACOH1N_08105 [Lutibacter sp.]